MARDGAIVIPQVPQGLPLGQAEFMRAVKMALEVLQGNGPAPEARRAPTLYESPLARFVDRGDPNAYDFVQSALTTDGNWHVLDLSGIVPVEAKAVVLHVYIRDDAVESILWFRKNGRSNTNGTPSVRTQIANVYNDANLVVALDSGRRVEYATSAVTFTNISITVTGWFV